ncbi:uncharacterized protein LOC123516897 isoform X1 [Portunus trituberculatus]|uniref:uncharacterized protein LOC123516897 isoform X1 n=1 Tax=Portunus trituberculatus TaxID=210409 RepID=UPI001E1CD41E|nr:uncharacterized protein LOC123516897 isoform X1 [Portunus trituberculatus]
MVDSPAVLLVFLALGLEGIPSLASVQHCHASPDVVVPGGSVDPVYYEEIPEARKMSATLFLQHLFGFEGISVEATYETYTLSAWFATDQCCPGTPQSFTWVPLKVEVEVKKHTFRYYFHYMLDFGGCVKECKKPWGFTFNDDDGTLKVVAHGSSRWKCDSPPHACLTTCNTTTTASTCQEPSTQLPVHSPSHLSPCNGTPTSAATPPSAVTPTPSAMPTTQPSVLVQVAPTVLGAASLVIIVAVSAVLFPKIRRGCVLRLRRPASLPSPPRHHRNSSVRISMNSLYEAYSGPESLQ